MKYKFKTTDINFKNDLEKLVHNTREYSRDISTVVTDILKSIKDNGDKALLELTNKFDQNGFKLNDLSLTKSEIDEYSSDLDQNIKSSIEFAAKRIEDYHKYQVPSDHIFTDETGTTMGYQWKSIERVGIYVPGGTASYPSTVLMNAIPAIVAGVDDIVMVTPAINGSLSPSTIYAANFLGIKEIYRIGGAQAIGALAFGTKNIMKVDKIVGPGNSYVAEAKKQVFGEVGIDMFAGPSEIVIISDGEVDPSIIASDLLSQAEHDNNSQSILITDNEEFANEVELKVLEQLETLPRKSIAELSWSSHGAMIITNNIDESIEISNLLAPEHLELAFTDAKNYLNKIKHAGAIFVGTYTPEAIGDYLAGPSHVLPTNRTARYSSGLSVYDFLKRSSIIQCTRESLEKIGSNAISIAKDEGLDGHARSIEYRLSKK